MTKKTRIILLSSICLLLAVLIFEAVLNVSTFKKNYIDSLTSSYKVIAFQGKGNIEYAVRYGKPLDRFTGMTDILLSIRSMSTDLRDVRIISRDGIILYNTAGENKQKTMPQKLLAAVDFTSGKEDSAIRHYQDSYHLFISIRDKQGQWIGSMDVEFSEDVVADYIWPYITSIIKVLLAIVLGGICLLWFIFQILPINGPVGNNLIFAVLLPVFLFTQTLFSFYTGNLFKEAYLAIAQRNMMLVGDTVQRDIEYVINKGITYNRLAGLDEYLRTVISRTMEVESIVLEDFQGNILTKAAVSSDSDRQSEREQYKKVLASDNQNFAPALKIYISPDYIASKLQAVWLDAATIVVLSFFLAFELINFLLLMIGRYEHAGANTAQGPEELIRAVRPACFLVFFGTDLSLSFIPMHMKGLFDPSWGLPISVVTSLPISAEMLSAGLATLLGGMLLDKKGWRFPFLTGAVFLGCGVLASGLSAAALPFILSRIIVGIGYGFCWMSIRGYIAKCPSKEGKAVGFAQFGAGILAGSSCGCAFGAIMAERLGYNAVYFIALSILIGGVVFTHSLLKDFAVTRQTAALQETGRLKQFLGDKSVLALLGFYIIPSTVCLVGFINYFFPLYTATLGFSAANTGRAIMLYGICIIYLGPIVGSYIGKQQNKRKFVLLAGIIGAGAMFLFSSIQGLWMAVLAIFLLGVADSIGAIAQNTFFLGLNATKSFGEGKALAVSGLVRKIGQALGPAMFGLVTAVNGAGGIVVIGGAYLLLLVFFLLMTNAYHRKA